MDSKTKGSGGEREFAEILRRAGIRAYRNNQIFEGGHNNPDVAAEVCDIQLHLEVKRVERLNLSKAVDQAVRDAGPGSVPVVAHRKNREPWLVTFRLADVLEVLEKKNVLRPLCEEEAVERAEEEDKRTTEEEYRAAEGVNKSTLWAMRKSPLHYRWLLDNPQPDTAALKMGRAVHAAVLTPEVFASEYAVIPDGIDRRTKAGKEAYETFMASSAGKEILTAEEAETARAIAAAVAASDDARKLLQGTAREVPLFWDDTETGLRCKCRVDAFSAERGIMIDLKTCTDASTEAFTREALKYGYHVQAAHYTAGFYEKFGKVPEWWFIVVEKSPPYAVNVLSVDDAFVCRGEEVRSELMRKVKECGETDRWPGYGVNQIFLTAWEEG